jgi:hypothetical protein
MGLLDTFHFDSHKYALHLSKDYTDRELKKKHHQKNTQINTCFAAIGVGIGGAPFTCGLFLLSSTYAGRQIYVLLNQMDLIQDECGRRNIPVPRLRKRDCLTGGIVGLATAGLGIIVPIGLDQLSGPAISGAAHAASTTLGTAVHHVSPHAAHELANAAGYGGHGVSHGVNDALTSQVNNITQHGNVGTVGANAM